MSTLQIAREQNQERAKEAVRKANYIASVIMSVGSGKGKMMLDLVKELIEAGKVKSVLYLCDNRRLRDSEEDGFPGEIEKWGNEKMKAMIHLECYQTVCKWQDRSYDLVLADEVDYAITPVYIKSLLNNKYKYKILVSGTLSLEKKRVLEKIAPIVYRFTTVDAENAGVINKTDYYKYHYKMTEGECKLYNTYTGKIASLAAIGTPFEDKEYIFWIRKRKQFLNSLTSSQEHCRKIMQAMYSKDKSNRMVIFCELTTQADAICKYSFHGKNEEDDNLSKFQSGAINALSVVAKIKRGINLKRANVAIFEGLSSSSTEWEQRNGRMKRLQLDETATVIFIIPWYTKKDRRTGEISWTPTVVEKWINKATENISNMNWKNLKL